MSQRSRRSFLKTLARTAVAVPMAGAVKETLFPSPAAASPAGALPGRSEAFWEGIRRQFSFADVVPMNAANLCPAFARVSEEVAEITRDIDHDPSFQNRRQYAEASGRSREKVAAKLRVEPEEIALVRNTSEANGIIHGGFPLVEGDEVILWNQNHPSNNVAWHIRAQRFKFKVVTVDLPANPKDGDELIAAFLAAVGEKTKLLTFTDISNVSGLRLPSRELCAAARRKNPDLHIHIDGAQSWGAVDTDLKAIDCDSYSSSSHKWLMGPKETGLLYVKAARVPEIWPGVVSYTWGHEADEVPAGALKFESLSQRNDAGLAAIGTAVDVHDRVGAEVVEARIAFLAGELKQKLKAAGARLVTPEAADLSAGVVIMEVPDCADGNRWQLVDKLYAEYGIAAAPTGGLRFCPHIYNLVSDLDRAVEGVAKNRDLWRYDRSCDS